VSGARGKANAVKNLGNRGGGLGVDNQDKIYEVASGISLMQEVEDDGDHNW
jgi:hypothetical protein